MITLFRSIAARGYQWPAAIVCVLAVVAVVDLTMLYVATNHPSFAIEDQYYEKALHWDQQVAQNQANRRLGWQANVSLRRLDATGLGELVVQLTDPAGLPLPGARIEASVFHRARPRHIYSETLGEVGDGRYRVSLPARVSGLYEVRLGVVLGDDVFTQTSTAVLWGS